MGILNKFGTNAGALVDTVIIGPTPVTDNVARVAEFGATMALAASDGRFQLQVSRDNFAVDIRTLSRILLSVGGTFLKVLTNPAVIQPGESFRVIFKQAVIGEASAELFGKTDYANIVD